MEVIIEDKTIRDIELFVFDKDGTLIDLYNYWYHMVELRAKELCDFYNLNSARDKMNLMSEMGIDLKNKRIKPEGPVGLLSRKEVQKSAEAYLIKKRCKDVPNVCSSVFDYVDELSLPLLKRLIRPLNGINKLFRLIKKNNGKIAVATSDKTKRAELAIKALGIANLVDFLIGSDRVRRPKPYPETLELIIERLDIEPPHAVMVGDSKADMQMGKNAHFRACIGVCTGLTSEDMLRKVTPYVVKDVSGIKIR